MSALVFDERTARTLERVYRTPDVAGQRARFVQLLGPRPGERILDVGLGPGLLAADLAAMVGEGGRAAGIDRSQDMVDMSKARCAEFGWTDFRVADATDLPFEDGSFDAVTATQVYEYVEDLPKALAEAHRVLRPGGRLFVLDTDWDSVCWATDDRARMRRVLDAWDAHLHDPHLPANLGPMLRDAGFQVTTLEVIPIVNPALHPHCYSWGISAAIASYVKANGVDEAEADAWLGELRERGRRGSYHFSIDRSCFGAVRLQETG